MKKYVYAVAFSKNGDFLLAKKNKKGYFFAEKKVILPTGQDLNGGGNYALPGGKLNRSEAPIDGARRKFFEETRFDIAPFPDRPTPYRGASFFGVYFQLTVEDLASACAKIAINLTAGAQAAQAVINGRYGPGEYNALMAAFPDSPGDNELYSIKIWNLDANWDEIQSWEGHPDLGWFFEILLYLKEQLTERSRSKLITKRKTPYQNFEEARSQVQKKVTIEISHEDLQSLQQAQYLLCFAKQVNTEDYCVVWQAYDKYFPNNIFSWMPIYQLFVSNQFIAGEPVVVSSNTESIALGQTSTLDKVGWLSPPFTGGPSDAITLINEYGPIHPGIKQLSTGIGGEQYSTPIFVSPRQVLTGMMQLQPTEKVLLWFEQNTATSVQFDQPRPNAIEIDMSERDSIKLSYNNGEWAIQPTATSPQSQSPSG
ncbi:MAG: NUDIX domain-containing protein [Bacteroidota bacterium]